MRPESQKLLADALNAAVLIIDFTRGHQLGDFVGDKLLRSAVYWQFAIIGETLSQLRKQDQSAFGQIRESSRIIDFRNQILHAYAVVQDNVTWQIIQDKLPILKVDLERLLATP